MTDISRRDFLNGVCARRSPPGLTPAAQIAAQPARYPPALTGLRGQHAGSFEAAHALARDGKSFARRQPADRGELRSRRGRRRHQRARGGVVLPARRRRAGAHPDPRQSRRFRRPRQAQRVHARWPAGHRLWRQRVDAVAARRSGATSPRACCASSASTSRASRPRSSAISMPRSACRAACSSRARHSAATRW